MLHASMLLTSDVPDDSCGFWPQLNPIDWWSKIPGLYCTSVLDVLDPAEYHWHAALGAGPKLRAGIRCHQDKERWLTGLAGWQESCGFCRMDSALLPGSPAMLGERCGCRQSCCSKSHPDRHRLTGVSMGLLTGCTPRCACAFVVANAELGSIAACRKKHRRTSRNRSLHRYLQVSTGSTGIIRYHMISSDTVS